MVAARIRTHILTTRPSEHKSNALNRCTCSYSGNFKKIPIYVSGIFGWYQHASTANYLGVRFVVAPCNNLLGVVIIVGPVNNQL